MFQPLNKKPNVQIFVLQYNFGSRNDIRRKKVFDLCHHKRNFFQSKQKNFWTKPSFFFNWCSWRVTRINENVKIWIYWWSSFFRFSSLNTKTNCLRQNFALKIVYWDNWSMKIFCRWRHVICNDEYANLKVHFLIHFHLSFQQMNWVQNWKQIMIINSLKMFSFDTACTPFKWTKATFFKTNLVSIWLFHNFWIFFPLVWLFG